jgi:hypothetical protein
MNTWDYFVKKWEEYLDEQLMGLVDALFPEKAGEVPRNRNEKEEAYRARAVLGFTPHKEPETSYPNFGYQNDSREHTLTMKDSTGKTQAVILEVDFSPKEMYAEWLKESRAIEMRAAGDLDRKSGVCETPAITAAPLFPIPEVYPANGRDETWVYVVYNDKRAFKTYKQQKSAAKIASQGGRPQDAVVPKTLATSKEIAAWDIPSGDVLAAVRCSRYWKFQKQVRNKNRVDWRHGVMATFLGPIQINPKITNQRRICEELKDRLLGLLEPYLGMEITCMEFRDLPDRAVFS